MLRRFNTGWKDGMYAVPSGHIEIDETVEEAMAREAKEEVGIEIDPVALKVVYVSFRRSPDREYVDFYLTADKWDGEPFNAEPDKSDDVGWFDYDNPPENTVDYVMVAMRDIEAGKVFGDFGFAER